MNRIALRSKPSLARRRFKKRFRGDRSDDRFDVDCGIGFRRAARVRVHVRRKAIIAGRRKCGVGKFDRERFRWTIISRRVESRFRFQQRKARGRSNDNDRNRDSSNNKFRFHGNECGFGNCADRK